MPSSTRRLSRTPSRRKAPPMESLSDLADLFLAYHQGIGSSPTTIRHYRDSLTLLSHCCQDEGIEPAARALSTATMQRFASWLRTNLTRRWRGTTERSIHGVHEALKDVKIWLTWLAEHEYLATMPKVPVPRLPHMVYPILSDEDLERIFAYDSTFHKRSVYASPVAPLDEVTR